MNAPEKKISLRAKLSLVLMLSGGIPLLFMVSMAISRSSAALEKVEKEKLVAVRANKAQLLRNYFGERIGDIETNSGNMMIQTAMAEFIDAYEEEKGAGGKKWAARAATYGGILKKIVDAYGYYDMFMISGTGDVVYTVARESDLGQNLLKGKLSGSVLAKAFASGLKGTSITDFQYYAVSGQPAAFTSAPISDNNGNRLGVLAFQLSTRAINDIMQIHDGLGESGETYLVGSDSLMRSDSRFQKKDETSILTRKVDTEAARKGLDGKTGVGVITDYRGIKVLSAYEPVKISGLPWTLIAEIDTSEAYADITFLQVFSFGICLFTVLALVAISFLVSRSITKPLNLLTLDVSDSSRNLESASSMISEASQKLSSGAAELSSNVEEISSSLEELQAVLEQNTKNVGQSEAMMQETNEGTRNVTGKIRELQDALNEISERSKKVSRIIKVIDDIAFQTNILALNAAVEAARAGEAGRGFAIVAEQVKGLAVKSSEAAKETAESIEIAIGSVQKGKLLGEKVIDIQAKAGEMTDKVAIMLNDINAASKEQVRGMGQISQAVALTNSVMQQTAANAEEIAASGEELLSQAEGLNLVVDRLEQVVKGRRERAQAKALPDPQVMAS